MELIIDDKKKKIKFLRSKFCENSPQETKKKSLIWFLLWTIATLKIRNSIIFYKNPWNIPCGLCLSILWYRKIWKKKKNHFKKKLPNLKKKIPKFSQFVFFINGGRKNKHCSRVNPQSPVFKINVTKSDDKWQSAAAAISGLNL